MGLRNYIANQPSALAKIVSRGAPLRYLALFYTYFKLANNERTRSMLGCLWLVKRALFNKGHVRFPFSVEIQVVGDRSPSGAGAQSAGGAP
jgi:hypothetical protein